MATRAEVAASIAYLTTIYAGWKPNQATQESWYEALKHLHVDALKAACQGYVKASDRTPTPSKLIDRAADWSQFRTLSSRTMLPAHERPPATPEQVQAACKDAIARIAAAPDIGGPNQKPPRNRELDGGAGTTHGPVKLDFKAALQDIWQQPPRQGT